MIAAVGQQTERGHATGHGLSLLLIAVSSLYFVLCLPSVHDDGSAHSGTHLAPSSSSPVPHFHAPAGHSQGDADVDHLPHAPHGDCDGSALSPEPFRLALMLFGVLFVVGSLGASRKVESLLASNARRRRCGCHRPLSGVRLLNVLCVARL
ncbi:hypothetical protein [Spirillospora sp. NPDC048823]|uniref:hypothetical protein n=1 Tax=unclassified Spirillospora TaxID=2642701 RepID=UPI00371AC0F1